MPTSSSSSSSSSNSSSSSSTSSHLLTPLPLFPPPLNSALDRLYNASLSVTTLEEELQSLANLQCLAVPGVEVLSGVQSQLKAFDLTPHSDNDDGNDADDDLDIGSLETRRHQGVRDMGPTSLMEEAMWDRDCDGQEVSRPRGIKHLRYFILDCRPHEDFVRYQVATSMHLDPNLLENVVEGEMIVEQLKAMSGSHFCLLGSNGNGSLKDHKTDPVGRFVKLFLQHGFSHISVLKGGMPACQQLIADMHRHRRVKSASIGGLIVMSRGGSLDEENQDKKSNVLRRWFTSRNSSSSTVKSDIGGGRGSSSNSRPSSPTSDRPNRKSRPGSNSTSRDSDSHPRQPRRSSKGAKSQGVDRKSSDLR